MATLATIVRDNHMVSSSMVFSRDFLAWFHIGRDKQTEFSMNVCDTSGLTCACPTNVALNGNEASAKVLQDMHGVAFDGI